MPMPFVAVRRVLWCGILTVNFAACRVPYSPTTSDRQPELVASGEWVEYAPATSIKPKPIDAGRFGIRVSIHGHDVLMGADHGSNWTIFTQASMDSIHVPSFYSRATHVDTLVERGGTALVLDSTADVTVSRGDTVRQYWGNFSPIIIDSMRIGRSLQLDVAVAGQMPDDFQPLQGLLGRDFLAAFDLEFNVSKHALRLYAPAVNSARAPRSTMWLPRGFLQSDCVNGINLDRVAADTVNIDSDEREWLHSTWGQRLLNTRELGVPLLINGHAITGMFDSGSYYVSMNANAAQLLGLTSPNVISDTVSIDGHGKGYAVTGIRMRVGAKNVSVSQVFVVDELFRGHPDVQDKPLVLFGLEALKSRSLYLSYSTNRVCLSGPSGP